MIARNGDWRFRSTARTPIPPVSSRPEYFRYLPAPQPQVSQEKFLSDNMETERGRRERLKRSTGTASRPPLTEQDLRIHGWLIARQAALHRERCGGWQKIRHLLFGNWLSGKT